MKLQVYKEKELTFKNADTATISINTAGCLVLNSATIFLLGITDKSKVVLAQDSEEKKDWYIAVDDKNGVPLKPFGKDKLGWQGKSIANKIIGSCDLPEYASSVLFRVSEEGFDLGGITYYPIITFKPMRVNRVRS